MWNLLKINSRDCVSLLATCNMSKTFFKCFFCFFLFSFFKTYQRDFIGCFIWDLFQTSWRRTDWTSFTSYWDVVTAFQQNIMEAYHWDALATFHGDLVGCFIWDVPTTLLARTEICLYNVATMSCCRVRNEEKKCIKTKVKGELKCYEY